METKFIINFLAMIMIVTSLISACEPAKSGGSDYFGNWKEENSNRPNIIGISKQGENYIIQERKEEGIEGIYSLTKDNNLSGQNGMVTIMFDKQSKKLLISAWGGGISKWIKVEGN
jgi:hypothetical protein